MVVLGISHGISRMRKSFAAQRRVGLELNGIEDEDVPPATDKSHVASLGGISIFCFRLARLFACLALFCISMVTITRDAHWKEDISRKENLLRVGLTGTYVSFLDFSTSEASDCCIFKGVCNHFGCGLCRS